MLPYAAPVRFGLFPATWPWIPRIGYAGGGERSLAASSLILCKEDLPVYRHQATTPWPYMETLFKDSVNKQSSGANAE